MTSRNSTKLFFPQAAAHLVVLCHDPEVPRAVLRLVPLPEVRVHGEVVADGVLPAVVLGLEVRVAVTEEKERNSMEVSRKKTLKL